MEGRKVSMPSCEFFKGGLANSVDLASVGSESMPKKVPNNLFNSDISCPVSQRGRRELSSTRNRGKRLAILSNSKRERASAIQLSFDESHMEEKQSGREAGGDQ